MTSAIKRLRVAVILVAAFLFAIEWRFWMLGDGGMTALIAGACSMCIGIVFGLGKQEGGDGE